MKLILCTLQDLDAAPVVDALSAKRIGVTRFGSTGGFLQQGNTTLLIGVEEAMLQTAMDEIQRLGKKRTKFTPIAAGSAPSGGAFYNYVEVEVGGGIALILDVDYFEQI